MLTFATCLATIEPEQSRTRHKFHLQADRRAVGHADEAALARSHDTMHGGRSVMRTKQERLLARTTMRSARLRQLFAHQRLRLALALLTPDRGAVG